ncbi:hypothetical protein GCK32_018156, partial [Trichostrongylus colubriformis]
GLWQAKQKKEIVKVVHGALLKTNMKFHCTLLKFRCALYLTTAVAGIRSYSLRRSFLCFYSSFASIRLYVAAVERCAVPPLCYRFWFCCFFLY